MIQAVYARSFERIRFTRPAKWELYSAYFVALGELTFYPRDHPTHIAGLASMAQLRARIALVGTREVISSVAGVFNYQNLSSREAQEAMALALRAMRRDVGEVDCRIDPAFLKSLMFRSSENV